MHLLPSFSSSFQRAILTLGELVSWWVETSTLKAHYVKIFAAYIAYWSLSELLCTLYNICDSLQNLFNSPRTVFLSYNDFEDREYYSLITTPLHFFLWSHSFKYFFTRLYLFVWMLLFNPWNFYSSYWIWKKGILAACPWLHLLAILDQIFSSAKWEQMIAALSIF